jgi:hypothetical protein
VTHIDEGMNMDRITRTTLAAITLALAAAQGFAQSTATAPAKPAAKAAKPGASVKVATAPSTAQPKLMTTTIEKCVACNSTIKRRVAVMPVKTGVLSSEAGISSPDLSSRMVESIEAALRTKPGILVVNRQELGDVAAEIRLGASSLANHELAPKAGRVIPAEMLLNVSIDRLDVATSKRRDENSNAKTFYDQARALEEEADRDATNAVDAQNRLQRANLDNQRIQEQNKQNQAQYQRIAAQGGNKWLGALGSGLSTMAAQWSEDDLVRLANESRQSAFESQQKRQQATSLRQRAQVEAERNVTETVTYNGSIGATWKAIDAQTGAVVASGRVNESDSLSDTMRASGGMGSGTLEQSSQRTSALVAKLMDKLVQESSRAVDQGIEKVAFSAQIVSVDRGGILLNAGQNYGLDVGDAFEILQQGNVATDPATGELLNDESTAVGKAVVTKVSAKTASAELFDKSGAIARGQKLKWIGIYK